MAALWEDLYNGVRLAGDRREPREIVSDDIVAPVPHVGDERVQVHRVAQDGKRHAAASGEDTRSTLSMPSIARLRVSGEA